MIALIASTSGGPDVDPFRLSYGDNEGDNEIAFTVVSYVVWVVFVIVMPILLINMLVSRQTIFFKFSLNEKASLYFT